MRTQKVLIEKEQVKNALSLPVGVDIQANIEGLVEVSVSLDEAWYDFSSLDESKAIKIEDLLKHKRLFTEKLLDEFDELTAMESSRDQMDRIHARVRFPKWKEENNMTNEIMANMVEELKLRNRW